LKISGGALREAEHLYPSFIPNVYVYGAEKDKQEMAVQILQKP
jgi:hypothetical protein